MRKIRLIHWNETEALDKSRVLRAWGYAVDFKLLDQEGMKALKSSPPGAVVIDLSRLPSHGRDVGLGLRMMKPTRFIPLVFVGGAPEKVTKVRELLPDAVYSDWNHLKEDLAHALGTVVKDPVVPRSSLSGYSGTPLPKKLGIKPDMRVGLVSAPANFHRTLGKLPSGAKLSRSTAEQQDLLLWFVRTRRKLEAGIEAQGASFGDGGLWIIWPKKTSGLTSDLSQAAVREVGLASGLVDYKVCAVDETWSGLKFTRRRSVPPRPEHS